MLMHQKGWKEQTGEEECGRWGSQDWHCLAPYHPLFAFKLQLDILNILSVAYSIQLQENESNFHCFCLL